MAATTIGMKISEADAAKVKAFEDLITNGTDAEALRKGLTQLYVKFTRFALYFPDHIPGNHDSELHYLSELIGILDEAKA